LIDGFARSRRLALAFSELRDVFGGAAYVPAVSVYLWDRIPRDAARLIADNFTEPPDIAIEIVSSGQSVNSLVRRLVWYVDDGVRVALVVDPDDLSVLAFRLNQPPRSARAAESIDIDDVLPGFSLTADDVFSALRI
jgi:Uma2 family endonuclease